MHRSLARYSAPVSFVQAPSWADFITTMVGFEVFGTHSGVLKDQFVAAMQGHAWAERNDSIRRFSRWLGFRRTGPSIDDTARSVINGLIRDGRLESNGSQIRRRG